MLFTLYIKGVRGTELAVRLPTALSWAALRFSLLHDFRAGAAFCAPTSLSESSTCHVGGRHAMPRHQTRSPMQLAIAAALLFLLPTFACAQSTSPFTSAGSPSVASLLKEACVGESIEPPYRLELWVEPAYGPEDSGLKTLIENFLRDQLHALGDVEVVNALDQKKPLGRLRLRVRYSKLRVIGCYDTLLGVVVGKIYRERPADELVLDVYGLAGIEGRELPLMCQKIVTRLDLNILSALRRMRSSSK